MSRSDAIFVVVLAALWVGVSGLAWGTNVAGGADPYGVVSQAALWVEGGLSRDEPLVQRLPWPDADATLSPLGYRPGPTPGTIVPIYPAGLPIVMAVFQLFGGPDAVFWVVPILGMLAVFAVAGLGFRVAGPTAGAFAALLLAWSPTVLFAVMWPMSDLPTAAWWAVVAFFVTRAGLPSAAAAGLSAGLAVLTRPNLVGLATVPLFYLAARWWAGRERRGFTRLMLYAGLTAVGCVTVAALYTVLYGSPLVSGYGDLDWFFEAERAGENVPGFLVRPLTVEPALVILAVVGAAAALRRTAPAPVRAAGWLCLGFVGVTLASYLFFYSFPEWWYLRILVPAYPALAVLGGVGVAHLRERTPLQWRGLLLATVALLVVFTGLIQAVSREVYRQWEYESRYAKVGRFVASELPSEAALFAFHHSGSIRYYADRLTIRFDVLPAEWLEPAVETLQGLGYAPFLVIEETEMEPFRERFGWVGPLGLLEWSPMAELPGNVNVRIYNLADAPHGTHALPGP